MTQLTAKQQVVLEAIQQLGKATAIDIAKVISGGQESADAHLRRLHKLKIIHVCEWGTGAYNHPIKVFAYGEGVDAVIDKKAHFAKIRKVRDALKAKPIKLYVYDKKAPIVPNTGWVSTIHTWDRSINNHDHIEYMARFQPRPDMAAEWLFNTPRSEI